MSKTFFPVDRKEVYDPASGSSHHRTISPVDGRYAPETKALADFFSEQAFTRYRIFIELSWLLHLSSISRMAPVTGKHKTIFKQIMNGFGNTEFARFKKIEEKTRHDVKAIEYYLREEFEKKGLSAFIPFIHFGLTSDDINNLAYGLILKECRGKILVPALDAILQTLKQLALDTKKAPVLARTHGQPAVPTTFGHEIAVYYARLKKQYEKIETFSFEGKCNGAVGCHNALSFVYPDTDWIAETTAFVSGFGLSPNPLTTQILPYDNWIEFFQIVSLTNMILTDLSVNMWMYVMNETVSQKKIEGQVGSSTMPQKINPIDFENTEGNLQLANTHFELYLRKLPLSRLQRDLSDSTVRRTFGEAFAYTLVGWKSCLRGLHKISLNTKHAATELANHYEVLAEAIQTFLRSKKDTAAYEKLKSLTRGKIITPEEYMIILKELGLDKEKMFADLSPGTYTGLAEKLTEYVG